MRTNIEIDDELMAQAMAATGATTKKAAVEAALRKVIQINAQSRILDLFGKVVWRGNDDDWFASDGEILEQRRKAEANAVPASVSMPTAEQEPAIAGELR